jgi:hypothetical protein
MPHARNEDSMISAILLILITILRTSCPSIVSNNAYQKHHC